MSLPQLTRSRLLILLAVPLLAVLVRVAAIVAAPPTAEGVLTLLNDSTDYHVLAESLLDGRGWSGPGGPTAFRPPVYPLFMAGVYLVFGSGALWAVALVQALLAGITTLLMSRLSRAMGYDDRVGVLSALCYAMYPAFIQQAPQILSEELGRFLLISGALLLLKGRAAGSLRLMAAAGATLALAVLNKSVLAAALPFLCLLALGWQGGWRPRLMGLAVFVLPILLLMGSWTVRNYAISGHFIPVSTNFPITFSQGVTRFSYYTEEWYGAEVELLPAPDDFLTMTQLRAYPGVEGELETGAVWSTSAREWIGRNRGTFVVLTFRKALHYWGPFVRNSPLVQLVAMLSMGPVLLLGWWGVLRALRGGVLQRRGALLALSIGLACTVPYAISQCDVRYRLAISEPFWMIFAAAQLLVLMPTGLRRVLRIPDSPKVPSP